MTAKIVNKLLLMSFDYQRHKYRKCNKVKFILISKKTAKHQEPLCRGPVAVILSRLNLNSNLQIHLFKRGRQNAVNSSPPPCFSETRGRGTAIITAAQIPIAARHTPRLSIKLVFSLIYFLVVQR
ncbi:hypothetical protein E2C01_057935 [Portunus trituberculatus]|uniref:Uncharacterized protein n=1 Tax=Portunus trituberculatus TaxID=210409 RepID=A0A5B7H3Z6_PORTR|nr:hypothetical protein [Portunus trituberculatus]